MIETVLAFMEAWAPAFVVTCLVLTGVFLGISVASERGVGAWKSGAPTPAIAPSVPKWMAIQDYVELSDKAAAFADLDEDAFLAGPFNRYLVMGADPAHPPRARARILEFGRGTLLDYCKRRADGEAIEARALAIAAAWFADKPNGDYMLEVLEGISNHNFRCERPGAATAD